MAHTYDPHCQDLAEVFLAEESVTSATVPHHTARVEALSSEIQHAIERWLEAHRLDEDNEN